MCQANGGVQFITDNYTIREVLAFPFLREDKQSTKEKFAAEVVDVQPLPEEGIRKSRGSLNRVGNRLLTHHSS